jgi:hypothetical protein
MVVSILFAHGGYNNEPDVTVPYNIRLITYTNPSTDIGPYELVFILRQLMGITNNLETGLKDNILEIEQNDSTVEIISPPYTKWKPTTTFRKPDGKFTIYEPKSKTSNLYLRIEEERFRARYSPHLETKLVYEVNILNQPIKYSIHTGKPLPKKKSIILYKGGETVLKNLGEWLKEISCFYEKEFPGKIINLIQLSCRHTDETAKYTSVDELAVDLENKLNLNGPLEGPATAEFPPPDKYGNRNQRHFYKGDYEYDFPNEYDLVFKDPPLILTKSKDVDIPASSGCEVGTGGKRKSNIRKINIRKINIRKINIRKTNKRKTNKRKTNKRKTNKRKTNKDK